MRVAAAICAFAAFGARGVTREEVARHYAPVLYEETDDPIKDLYSAFDFDGDWNGDNQAENMECWSDASKCNTADNPSSRCAFQQCPLIATIYYTVIETPTHWFIQYMPYHPLDWKITNGHENDTESLMAVVAKGGGDFGKLQVIETRFHLYWYRYSADPAVSSGADVVNGPVHSEPVSGRPAFYVQMVGHGICGGFSPPNYLFPDLQLTCYHDQQPHIANTGVVYSPDVVPVAMPVVASGRTVDAGYNLVELLTSVWPHIHEIGPGKAFLSAIDYQGERCGQFDCPTQFGGAWEGNEGQSPGEPWAQPGGAGVNAVGDQFFDPAYTMSKRLTFPEPFSLDYCFNPFLNIADSCAAVPDAGTPPDAGTTSDDAGAAPADAGAQSTDAGAAGADAGGGGTIAPNARRGCNSGAAAGALAALVLAFALRRGRGSAARRNRPWP